MAITQVNDEKERKKCEESMGEIKIERRGEKRDFLYAVFQ